MFKAGTQSIVDGKLIHQIPPNGLGIGAEFKTQDHLYYATHLSGTKKVRVKIDWDEAVDVTIESFVETLNREEAVFDGFGAGKIS